MSLIMFGFVARGRENSQSIMSLKFSMRINARRRLWNGKQKAFCRKQRFTKQNTNCTGQKNKTNLKGLICRVKSGVSTGCAIYFILVWTILSFVCRCIDMFVTLWTAMEDEEVYSCCRYCFFVESFYTAETPLLASQHAYELFANVIGTFGSSLQETNSVAEPFRLGHACHYSFEVTCGNQLTSRLHQS